MFSKFIVSLFIGFVVESEHVAVANDWQASFTADWSTGQFRRQIYEKKSSG